LRGESAGQRGGTERGDGRQENITAADHRHFLVVFRIAKNFSYFV
jgi:hypothetical protein